MPATAESLDLLLNAAPDEGEAGASGAIAPGGDRGGVGVDERCVFDSDVRVRGPVADGAQISARGSLVVDQLIGAATVEVEGDLIALGGINGREVGRIVVKGVLRATYLDATIAEVSCLVALDRQAINSRLTVHGVVECPDGALIGGNLRVARRVRVGTLGSESGVPTRITLASVPSLEPALAKLDSSIEELTASRDACQKRNEFLSMPGQRLGPAEKEEQTELSFRTHAIETLLTRSMLMREEIAKRIDMVAEVDMTFLRMMHAGVIVQLRGTALKVKQDIEGPARITRDPKGVLVLTREGDTAGIPLSRFAEVMPVTD